MSNKNLSISFLSHSVLHVAKVFSSIVLRVPPGELALRILHLSLTMTISVGQEVVRWVWWRALQGQISLYYTSIKGSRLFKQNFSIICLKCIMIYIRNHTSNMMLILTVNCRDFTVHSFLKYICNIIGNAYTSKLELINIQEKINQK